MRQAESSREGGSLFSHGCGCSGMAIVALISSFFRSHQPRRHMGLGQQVRIFVVSSWCVGLGRSAFWFLFILCPDSPSGHANTTPVGRTISTRPEGTHHAHTHKTTAHDPTQMQRWSRGQSGEDRACWNRHWMGGGESDRIASRWRRG